VGSKVDLSFLHEGAAKQVSAHLAEVLPQKLEVPSTVAGLEGVTLGSIEPGSPLYGRAEGVVVLEIEKNAIAARAGLRSGDVIVNVNQEPVKSPEDVVRIAKGAREGLLLGILRDGSSLFIAIG
jgi:S1-C subfamily serine protease